MSAITASNKKTLLKLLQHHKDSVALIESLLTGTTLDDAPAATDASSGSGRKSTKGIKRGPRGSSGFDLFKKHVRAEMEAARPGVKFSLKEVADECAARKAATPTQYDEAHWKARATALKTETSAAGAASDGESAGSNDSKKRGRPKGSKNKAKAAEPTPAPAASKPPLPAESDEEVAEEEVEAEVTEWTWKGKVYFKSEDNDVFENIDGAPGDSLGIYNPLKDRIE